MFYILMKFKRRNKLTKYFGVKKYRENVCSMQFWEGILVKSVLFSWGRWPLEAPKGLSIRGRSPLTSCLLVRSSFTLVLSSYKMYTLLSNRHYHNNNLKNSIFSTTHYFPSSNNVFFILCSFSCSSIIMLPLFLMKFLDVLC